MSLWGTYLWTTLSTLPPLQNRSRWLKTSWQTNAFLLIKKELSTSSQNFKDITSSGRSTKTKILICLSKPSSLMRKWRLITLMLTSWIRSNAKLANQMPKTSRCYGSSISRKRVLTIYSASSNLHTRAHACITRVIKICVNSMLMNSWRKLIMLCNHSIEIMLVSFSETYRHLSLGNRSIWRASRKSGPMSWRLDLRALIFWICWAMRLSLWNWF